MNGKSCIKHIIILLVISAAIGIYLICRTFIIAKDSVTFIEYARNFEIEPTETMMNQYQHPGYPFLILAAHKVAEAFYKTGSVLSWVYSAQFVTLLFRLLSITVLYLLGRDLVGPGHSFQAMLILLFLPDPARLGSDALSDWPNFFFLATGFWLLFRAAKKQKWWIFGLVGFFSGMGYLVRPESAQLIVVGSLWLIAQVFSGTKVISKRKTGLALASLVIGFLIVAGPYMNLKGAVFPKKQVGKFVSARQAIDNNKLQHRLSSNRHYAAALAPTNIIRAFGKLAERISEILMWFFVLPWLIGLYKYLKKHRWLDTEKFLITVLIGLNSALMLWLYCKHGYMSRRHVLPIVLVTIFYLPAGLEIMAGWLAAKFEKYKKIDSNFCFTTLLIVGICICIPKLIRPVRANKRNFLDAANWLAENTNANDIVAVPDMRISFYAGRQGIQYADQTIPKEAEYAVKVFENEKDTLTAQEKSAAEILFSNKDKDGKSGIIIYRNPLD